jgi:hypothetical protein
VVRVDPQLVGSGSGAGRIAYRWDAGPPGRGSDNPYMRIHLSAESARGAYFDVKVTIEGPKNADPYQ